MLIVLDFDGTLIDMTERWWRLHLDVARDSRLPHCGDKDSYVAQKREGTAEGVIMGKLSSDVEAIRSYEQERLLRIELPEYLRHDALFSDTLPTLRALRRRGHRLVLLTKRRSRVALLEELKHLGIDECFDEVLVTEKEEKISILRARYDPRELALGLFLSDDRADLDAASELGLRGIASGYGCRSREFLAASGAQSIINSLKDILSYAS